VQMFTLTNTGNVPLTGVPRGTIAGTGAASFVRVNVVSTCGPAGTGQIMSNTTLAPGTSCVVAVRFAPSATTTAGTKNATLSLTDLAGTQTSTLTGTAQ
jgi:hypothetical protein